MQIIKQARVLNITTEYKKDNSEITIVEIDAYGDVMDESVVPRFTKRGAFITFEENGYLVSGEGIIPGDHVEITFQIIHGLFKDNGYNKLYGVSIEKTDAPLPSGSLFSSDEDTAFDYDPTTGKLI